MNRHCETCGDKVFTFGSNLAGRHGKGAALHARLFHAAVYGRGIGLMGRYGSCCYAIPTKDESLHPLSLIRIRGHVEEFKAFAAAHPEMTFLVTAIGCGLRDSSRRRLLRCSRGRRRIASCRRSSRKCWPRGGCRMLEQTQSMARQADGRIVGKRHLWIMRVNLDAFKKQIIGSAWPFLITPTPYGSPIGSDGIPELKCRAVFHRGDVDDERIVVEAVYWSDRP